MRFYFHGKAPRDGETAIKHIVKLFFDHFRVYASFRLQTRDYVRTNINKMKKV